MKGVMWRAKRRAREGMRRGLIESMRGVEAERGEMEEGEGKSGLRF